jgi:hypothetical protein
MLPGFRFLFAAIVLSMSILVFGLGAAALLRAAHEEFASNPTWRATPETVFAQPSEPTPPVLAILRVDTPAADKAPDNAPADATPAATTSAPAEAERIAALKPEDSPPPETAKPETPVAESPAQNETASAPADAPAADAETKITETKITETKIAETKIDETKIAETNVATSEEVAAPANPVAAPAASEPAGTPVSPDAGFAATKIATLGGLPVTIETPGPVKVASAKPDPNVIKKRPQAKRAIQRRRLAARPRLATQVPQQPANPFGQPAPTIVRSR